MKSRGFSLVELMIVVAVVGIAGGLALFGMSEQIADARAKSEAIALLQGIRAEHRSAKERMRGLTIKSEPGTPNKVTFQSVLKGCVSDGTAPRVLTFEHALLKMSASVACFNDRGELNEGTGGTAILPAGPSANFTTPPADPEPLRMAIVSGARPERTMTRNLRIDRNTINEHTTVLRTLEGDGTVTEEILSFATIDLDVTGNVIATTGSGG